MGKHRSLRIAVLLVGAGLTAAGGCTNFVANSRNADGVTLFQRGQYQDALQKFQEATYADPGQRGRLLQPRRNVPSPRPTPQSAR